MRHQRANHQPLGDPACRLRLLTVVDALDLKPRIDQTSQALLSNVWCELPTDG
jgi:hypothetical protein